ncbi:MAG: MFS transporter [Deltaproteobacteria bacterium]|nr:MFS transporter [Deltaproteobacteria bacterium]
MLKTILPLYIFSFFMIMPVVGVFPVLPLIRDDLSISYSQISIFVASLGIVRICFAFPSGVLADKFDKKKILLLSALLSLSGLILLSFSHSIYQLVFSRVLIGAGSILSSITILVLLAQEASPQKKGVIMSMSNVVHSSGYIISSALVGALAQWYHWRIPFFVLAGFILASCFLVTITFTGKRRPERIALETADMEPNDRAKESPGTNISGLVPVFVVSFFAFFYRGGFRHTLIPFYGKEVFQINVMDLGFYLSLMGIVSIANLLVFGVLSDRYGRKIVTILGLFFSFAAVGALILPESFYPFLMSCVLVGLGSTVNSMPNVLISDFAPRAVLGRVMGINRLFSNLGYFVGASLTGAMLDHFGFRVPLYLLMAFCLLVLVLSCFHIHDKNRYVSQQMAGTAYGYQRPCAPDSNERY